MIVTTATAIATTTVITIIITIIIIITSNPCRNYCKRMIITKLWKLPELGLEFLTSCGQI
jgi:hypothetical protein